MKEHIYTIPINEAFDLNCECPICHFMDAEENKRIEYTLGASMMEPAERIAYNETGFCKSHTKMMYDFGNRLSHALILETRTEYLCECIDEYVDKLINQKKKSLFKSKNNDLDFKEATLIKETSQSCVICQRLLKTERDFISNIIYLYRDDIEFRKKFLNSKGFCFNHFNKLISTASSNLGFDESKEFILKLSEIEKNNLQRIKEDVNWFTKKFDYRYKDEDWKNSKDAVQRACTKISGAVVE